VTSAVVEYGERASPAWCGGAPLPAMEDAEFRRWSALLRERTGMSIPSERRSFLATGVGIRMRELGFHRFTDYYDFVRSGLSGRLEWAALVDRLTVQETRFFRDPLTLALLEDTFLPMAATRAAKGQSVHVWSAGCATGEEAYSLAMLLDRQLERAGVRPYYGVTGSDISLRALGRARRGVYGARRLATLPCDYRERYVTAEGGGGRVVERLRRRTCFTRVNLLEDIEAPLPPMDLVYCQNVLIYFDRDARRRIADHLAARVRPGGLLVLGAGEILEWRHPEMKRVGGSDAIAYRRTGGCSL